MNATRMKIYLAGPITGHSGREVLDLYAEKTAILSDLGYQVLQPMVGKTHALRDEPELVAHGYTEIPTCTNHAIFTRDRWMVQQADIVLVDFDNAERVSIGSCMEMAWASLLNKQVVLVMPKDNIHEHAFILEAATVRFYTIEDAFDYLKELAASQSWSYLPIDTPILTPIED